MISKTDLFSSLGLFFPLPYWGGNRTAELLYTGTTFHSFIGWMNKVRRWERLEEQSATCGTRNQNQVFTHTGAELHLLSHHPGLWWPCFNRRLLRTVGHWWTLSPWLPCYILWEVKWDTHDQRARHWPSAYFQQIWNAGERMILPPWVWQECHQMWPM